MADAHGSQLSPDRAWLAHVVESGVATDGRPAQRDVEVVRLSAPFERFLLTGSGGGHPAALLWARLLYTSPSPRDRTRSRQPSSA